MFFLGIKLQKNGGLTIAANSSFQSYTKEVKTNQVQLKQSAVSNMQNGIMIDIFVYGGQLIQSSDLDMGNGGKVDYDFSGNKAGVYFLKIQTESSVITKRVILSR